MPIYEYACPACGNEFEKLMKIGADAPPCPECGTEDVKKKVSLSGFVLKGGGWYRDHYGLKSSSGGSDSGSGGSSGSSGSSGSDGGSSSNGGGSSSSSTGGSDSGSSASAAR